MCVLRMDRIEGMGIEYTLEHSSCREPKVFVDGVVEAVLGTWRLALGTGLTSTVNGLCLDQPTH